MHDESALAPAPVAPPAWAEAREDRPVYRWADGAWPEGPEDPGLDSAVDTAERFRVFGNVLAFLRGHTLPVTC
jgi:hypothetical protein